MKKKLLFYVLIFISNLLVAQSVNVFENVPFYGMYSHLGTGEKLPEEAYSQIPEGAIRFHAYERDVISRKLSEEEIKALELGTNLMLNIKIISACDNYDRIGGVNLVLVPKGSKSYFWNQSNIKRIEIGRFITPFLDKNKSPKEVPYRFRVDNIKQLFSDSSLKNQYDFWVEFRADGHSAAANEEIKGCANRTDVFRGTLVFESILILDDAVENKENSLNQESFFMPLKYREILNNYNATDELGKTVKNINFKLDNDVANATLFLSMSNHGARFGTGEEYHRRNHYIYLDDKLVYEYKPGGRSCEPFRYYNTNKNGIYFNAKRPLLIWLSFNNWCPGDVIPNREIELGTLSKGNHKIRIEVPEAEFQFNDGFFLTSLYLQNSKSGQHIVKAPTNFHIVKESENSIELEWNSVPKEDYTFEILIGNRDKRKINDIYNKYKETENQNILINGLKKNEHYAYFIRSKKKVNDRYEKDEIITSEWVGPLLPSSSPKQIIIDDEEPMSDLNASESKILNIYPNPVVNHLNIDTKEKITKVDIYNISGRIVGNFSDKKIDLTSYPKGVYTISIQFEDGKVINRKIQKK